MKKSKPRARISTIRNKAIRPIPKAGLTLGGDLLGPRDAAFIFRDDGTYDVYFPDLPDDSAEAPQTLVWAARMAAAIGDPEIRALIETRLSKIGK